MSGYKFHLIFGFLISLIVLVILAQIKEFNLLNVAFLIPWLIITLTFSIIPDIDARKSKASFILHIFIVLCLVSLFIPLLSLNTTMSMLFVLLILELYHLIFSKRGKNHRHWSHNILFGFVLSVFVLMISSEWLLSLFAFISFLSHLIVDKFLPY